MKLFYVVAFLLAQQLALPLSSAHPLLRNLAASEGGTYDFSGDATTYGDGHEWASGNCGFHDLTLSSGHDSAAKKLFVALNNEQWNDLAHCGQCVEVMCDGCNNNKVITAYITDKCPECKHGDLDFSPAAFQELTGAAPTRLKIQWKFTPCDATFADGGILYHVNPQSNPQWLAIQPYNFQEQITKLEIRVGDDVQWKAATKPSSGSIDSFYFVATSDAVGHEFTPPFQLRVTYASGEAVQSIFYSTDHVGARAAQTQTPTSANTTSSPTAEPSTSPVATIASYAATGNGFSSCKFNFGAAYTQGQSFDGLDYVSVWIGSPSPQFGNNFNPFFHGTMLDACLESSVTPYFYAYIIAFMARSQENLQDCDVSGSKNLCTDGADFIRGNRQGILDVYANYATETAKKIGSGGTVIWHIEPDWYQYSNPKQNGGGLSAEFMKSLFDDIVGTIKASLPNAKIAFDVSPWNNDQASWWSNFAGSAIDFVATSGGRTEAANPRIRLDNNNLVKWSGMYALTGKHVLADTGYGVGGGATGHDAAWDDIDNLNGRIADGVIGIMQQVPGSGWASVVSTLRTQLQPMPGCGASKLFSSAESTSAPGPSKAALPGIIIGVAVGAIVVALVVAKLAILHRSRRSQQRSSFTVIPTPVAEL